MSKTQTRYNDILCIGIGISGICLGAQLKRKWNFTDIHFYDRNESFGGTWLVNRYPGVACDVPTILYSFSFERNADTSKIFASGANIYDYLSNVIDKHELRPRMTFSTNWLSATWDEARHLWVVQLQDLKTGETYIHECRVLYSAIGLLNTASTPHIPGLESFKGPVVHTFEWPDHVDVTDKNVIVIGNGCSATQVIPAILPASKSITQFFRSAHYYYPIRNEPYKGLLKWGMELPVIYKLMRLGLYQLLEVFGRGFVKDKKGNKIRAKGTEVCLRFMKKTAPEKYHSILTPDYPLGCKRRICDDIKTGYLRALHSDKIHITKDPITQIIPEGVRTADNTIYPADIIITATGFDTSNAGYNDLAIIGRGGETAHEYWKKKTVSPTAYNTACMPGFPNFFLLFGPSSPTGHTSAIMAIENIVNYSMKLIKPIIISKHALEVEVKPEAARAYCTELDKANGNLVIGECTSLYLVGGKNRGVYPWSQFHFWRQSTFPKWNDLSYVYTGEYAKTEQFRGKLKLFLYTIVIVLVVSTTITTMMATPWTKYIPIPSVWNRIIDRIYIMLL